MTAEWKSKARCPHCNVMRVWSKKHEAKRQRHSLTSNFLAEILGDLPLVRQGLQLPGTQRDNHYNNHDEDSTMTIDSAALDAAKRIIEAEHAAFENLYARLSEGLPKWWKSGGAA